MEKAKKFLAVLIVFTFILQMCLPVYADDSVKNLSLETGQYVTVTVPYYEDSYTIINGVEPVLFISTNEDVATAYKTGITMSSSGNSLSVQILGKTAGNTNIKIAMRESGEILAQYAVTVTKSEASKLRLCKDAHTTISFKYNTEKFSYKTNDSSANLNIHKSSTSQMSINGNYYSSTTMEISFGIAGEYVLTIYDDRNSIIAEYNAIITEHKWDSGVITTEPTCTKNGSKKYTCQKCGVTQENSDDSPALGHDYSEEWTIDQEPTCTELGSKSKHCKRCGDKSEITKIEKIDHTWSEEYTVDKEATCTEKGQQSKHCVACNAVDESSIEDIAPMGHKWSDKYTIDKEATCTKDGQKSIHCEVCDAINKDSIEEIKSTGHTWDKGKVTKEPTCTENGEKVYTCECGETKKENIKATGHKWNDKYTTDKAATCTENGSESIHCTICKVVKKDSEKVISKTGHNYGEWIVVNEPTDSKEGLEKKTCKNCGDEITQKIPKLVGQWMSDSRGYWYKYPNGEHSKPDWGKIDGYWYYFDANGYRMTGWQHIRGNWYYLANDGKMAADTWIGSYYVNASGEWVKTAQPAQWIKSGNLWWYRHTDGSYTKNGWETINGKKYHFDNVGWMQTDWQKIDGNWYYFGGTNDGAMKTGWQIVNGTWYYMYSDGKMAANTWVGNYWVDGSGAWTKTKQPAQWVLSGNRWWYRHEDGGYTTNGFETIGGKIYYFDGAGWMVTGWRNVNNKWYYFDGSGAMKTKAWIGDYYVGSNGVMATNAWIGNYYVGNDGKWVPGNNR